MRCEILWSGKIIKYFKMPSAEFFTQSALSVKARMSGRQARMSGRQKLIIV